MGRIRLVTKYFDGELGNYLNLWIVDSDNNMLWFKLIVF